MRSPMSLRRPVVYGVNCRIRTAAALKPAVRGVCNDGAGC